MAAIPMNAEQMQRQIYTCSTKIKHGTSEVQSFKDCEKAFAHAFQFELFDTVTDGDCFFHALEEFGRRSRYPALHKTRQQLRDAMVEYLLGDKSIANWGYTEPQLRELKKPGAFAIDAGDLPSQNAHKAFGINLHVCVFNRDPHQHTNYLTLQSVYFAKDVPDVPDVYVLRIGAHYKLLWPRNLETTQILLAIAMEDEAPKERQRKNIQTQKNAEAKKKAHISPKKLNSLERALKAIANAEKATRKSPKKTPSMERNLKAIANALANQEKESMKRNLKAIANAEQEARNKAKHNRLKNNITRKGAFSIKTKYKDILTMSIAEIEEFIRNTLKLKIPKLTKQQYLDFISDQLNSM